MTDYREGCCCCRCLAAERAAKGDDWTDGPMAMSYACALAYTDETSMRGTLARDLITAIDRLRETQRAIIKATS